MITKFKNIEDSESLIWNKTIDSTYMKKINDFFRMIEKLSNFKIKKGIQKFKNFSDN